MPANWTLVPKLKPEKTAEHERLLAERDAKQEELDGVGLLARLLPGPAKQRARLKAEIKNLQSRMAACYGPVGWDLDPPRIGHDEKATKWYRDFLARDPDAWPLPPEEMLEEMKGQPVWELSKHREISHLDVGWPKDAFPLPSGPGLSMELLRKLQCNLSAEDAAALGVRVQEEVLAYFRRKHPQLETAAFDVVVNAVVKGAVPGGPPGSIDQRDVEAAHHALSAAQWLVFWGRHGYGFRCSEPVG